MRASLQLPAHACNAFVSVRRALALLTVGGVHALGGTGVLASFVAGVTFSLALGERFAADPTLSALFGAYDDLPAAPGIVSNFRNLLHHHVHHRNAGPAETFWTGLGAVRRRASSDAAWASRSTSRTA